MPQGKKVNRQELAAITGRAKTVLIDWEKQGMPVEKKAGGRGKPAVYDTRAVIDYIVDQATGGPDGKKENEKDRLDRLRGDQVEMKNAEDRGDLINRTESANALADILITVRNRLLQIGAKAGPMAHNAKNPKAAAALIDEVVREALTELSEIEIQHDPDFDEVEE